MTTVDVCTSIGGSDRSLDLSILKHCFKREGMYEITTASNFECFDGETFAIKLIKDSVVLLLTPIQGFHITDIYLVRPDARFHTEDVAGVVTSRWVQDATETNLALGTSGAADYPGALRFTAKEALNIMAGVGQFTLAGASLTDTAGVVRPKPIFYPISMVTAGSNYESTLVGVPRFLNSPQTTGDRIDLQLDPLGGTFPGGIVGPFTFQQWRVIDLSNSNSNILSQPGIKYGASSATIFSLTDSDGNVYDSAAGSYSPFDGVCYLEYRGSGTVVGVFYDTGDLTDSGNPNPVRPLPAVDNGTVGYKLRTEGTRTGPCSANCKSLVVLKNKLLLASGIDTVPVTNAELLA